MGYRNRILTGDGLRNTYTYIQNNIAVIRFPLTQRLKQILPGKTAGIFSIKRFEKATPTKSGICSSTNFHFLMKRLLDHILTAN